MARVTLFTDAFPQADENPLSSGGTWAGGYGTDNSFKVVSNQVQAVAPNVGSTMTHTGALPNNQWAKIKYAALGAAYTEVDILLRHASPATQSGYMAGFWRDGTGVHAQIVKITTGTQVRIGGPVDLTFAANDEAWFEAIDTTLTLYQNTTQLIQVTGESTYTSGRAGLIEYTQDAIANTLLDDFAAGGFSWGPLLSDRFSRLVIS